LSIYLYPLLETVGAILLAIWSTFPTTYKVIPIIAGAILVLIGVIFSAKARRKQESELKQREVELIQKTKEIQDLHVKYTIRGLIDEIQRIIGRAVSFRANVMFFNEQEKHLYIKWDVNMNGYADKTIKLNSGVGCAGTSYARGEQILGDLENINAQEWGLNKDQVAMTQDIRAIISTPLFLDNRVIAVLNIDSTLPIKNTGFQTKEVQQLCSRIANTLSVLFQVYSIL
jgi:transcriptional regulator with GAF, ATPase, and Fis domain